ncbi:MAG: endopeptidase La [Oligoflexia bacterium]|nr:endopeptidase La [Oligoflexia bacterium]MBF0364776.1 endopeptidase La [Oligoflexia bacterium]
MTNINESGGADVNLEILPLLPVRNIVVYPFMILPLFVGRESSIQSVKSSLDNYNRLIVLASQKDISVENPAPEEIYNVGTLAMIMRERSLPDGRVKILIQGLSKVYINEFIQEGALYRVRIKKVENIVPKIDNIALTSLMKLAREQLEKLIAVGKTLSPDILMVLEDIQDPGRLSDLIASNLNLKVEEAQHILETLDPVERLHRINRILSRELEGALLQNKAQQENQNSLLKNQKESILRERIRALKSEFAEENSGKGDEFAEIREKIKNAQMPADAEKEVLKQLSRLEKMHPESSESSILRNYIDCVLEMPWASASEDMLDLVNAKGILDEDHFDLEKVKERILEFLAVKMLKGKSMKGPILCFMGPPGVGKTSLGRSIAKAMGRSFVRISLGGIKDEAEIRGHRRTYVGAMPGRLIQALQQAKTNNPVIMLDEVDKLGSDYKGDPSSALLEVLDPEQNHSFRDHYLNLPFDLSNAMFIATANTIESIPHPLRDRMEILYISGYTEEDKLAIANRFLIQKQIDENGISNDVIKFSDESVINIVRHYTCEAGVRTLERSVGNVCRKIAKKIACGDMSVHLITAKMVEEMLGPPLYNKEDEIDLDQKEIGVVTGLAWTPVGGEVIRVETRKMKGKGLTLTGHLGEVMQESARTAIGLIRCQAKEFGIDEDFFDKYEIHIHVPAGATPKDGPSAGITIATAIISLITGISIQKNIAMTGEITLTGKVLPIGGVKEKALAAMRHGVKKIIIPWSNQKDLVEIPKEFHDKLEFVCVRTIENVLAAALSESIGLLKKGKKKRGMSNSEGVASVDHIESFPSDIPIAAAKG